ncbi:MAG: aldehyde dehydrogenase family protein [Planctomycetes bacterium]|nr:aldehyde dehydrogenase family protein [Planctomycetota bacterium]
MLHIPILRNGQPYTSVDKVTLVHHATGEPMAEVSQANSGMVARDIRRMNHEALEDLTISQLLEMCKKAACLFATEELPLGTERQSFDDYLAQVSGTTGMPVTYCRRNAEKIHKVLDEMEMILRGLAHGFDLSILDKGYGDSGGPGAPGLSYYRRGRLLGAVLPSNSPGVHGLWIPAIALKTPLVLKPGREEPWTPYRIIEALIAAGMPRAAFGFYPTDHAGAAEILRLAPRSMLFGDSTTTRPWHADPRVEIHGPGESKIVLGSDWADDWESGLEVMVTSIAGNAGRSCINASAVFTPAHGEQIAQALAERLAKVQALPADDPQAEVAAFANAAAAERISAMIDSALAAGAGRDLTAEIRGSSRLVKLGRVAYLLPTIIWADRDSDSAALREFPFPYATVVECPQADIPQAIGRTLVVTALTRDSDFIQQLMNSPNVDRLNVGPIPTWQISWDQPHEGNLFEHLYRRRAFQIDPAA